MKYYSCLYNRGKKAISLEGVRTVLLIDNTARTKPNFTVRVEYNDKENESFFDLSQEKAEKIYDDIMNLLNERDGKTLKDDYTVYDKTTNRAVAWGTYSKIEDYVENEGRYLVVHHDTGWVVGEDEG